MQVGIVLDNNEKFTNEEVLTNKNIPISFVGFRKFMIPDKRHMQYVRSKILSVTELMKFLRLHLPSGFVVDGGCVMQPYFDYNLPVYLHPSSFMSLMQGRLMHEALKPTSPSIVKEMHVAGKLFGNVVEGDIDFYDRDRGIIYDLKTQKSLYKVPKPFDVVQTYLYAKLLEQNGMKVDSSTLMYLSHNQLMFAKFLKCRYDDTFTFEDIEHNLILREPVNISEMRMYQNPVGLTIATKDNVETQLNAYWHCAYCPYRRYCPYAKDNMYHYIKDLVTPKTNTNYINYSYVYGRLAEIRSSGVKEGDEFMYPEEELYDVYAEVFGSNADRAIESVKRKREIVLDGVNPVAKLEW